MDTLVGLAIVAAVLVTLAAIAVNALADRFVFASVWLFGVPAAIVGLFILLSNLKEL